MANTFITPSMVDRDASLALRDEMLIANLCTRSTEARFATKVGDTVSVKIPPDLGVADEFVSSTAASNVTETEVEVVLEKHFYKRVDLTSNELTLEVDDFNALVTVPCVKSIVRGIEVYGIEKAVGGFARNLVGTAGTNPSTHAHIIAAEKQIFDNRGDVSNLVSIITSTSHAAFSQLDIFTSAEFGTDRPAALANGTLGRVAGISMFRSPNASTFTRASAAAEAALGGSVAGSGTAGAAVISMASFTTETGTIYEGARFTVAGDTTVYTVTANAVKASNAATVSVYPVLATSPSSALVTWQAAATENVVYNPRALACAVVPGAIIGPNVAAVSIDGIGVRVISDVSTSTLAGTWVFDVFCGFKVVQPKFGAVMQG
jgi:hypothetical protein